MPFSPDAFIPDEIIQIGAGGVGSRLAFDISFFMRGNFDALKNTTYTIVDHDRVSPSNLSRQMFFYHEISDQTKGQILVNRFRDMVRIQQIPEPINQETLPLIFNEEKLRKKLLVIMAADNGLVVKQVITKLLADAKNDWLWLFTGANLVEEEIAGKTVQTGQGQAYAYGVMNNTPLFPTPPTEVLLDIMETTGFGPTSTGQNCGVDVQSGAQTPLMNNACAYLTMMLIQSFFEKGLFGSAAYFTNGVSVDFGDFRPISEIIAPINLEQQEKEQEEDG
jgi:hypothetical protein